MKAQCVSYNSWRPPLCRSGADDVTEADRRQNHAERLLCKRLLLLLRPHFLHDAHIGLHVHIKLSLPESNLHKTHQKFPDQFKCKPHFECQDCSGPIAPSKISKRTYVVGTYSGGCVA